MPTPRTVDPWIRNDPVALDDDTEPVSIYLIQEDDLGDQTFLELTNIECLFIEHRAGTHPDRAGFVYKFDERAAGVPNAFEQVFNPIPSSDTTIIKPCDRLAVSVGRWDDMAFFFFYGEVLDFNLNLDDETEMVGFQAEGIARRCRDNPIRGMRMRDGWKPEEITDPGTGLPRSPDPDVYIDLPAQFNPQGIPNASPAGADRVTVDAESSYPTFLDPLLEREPDVRRLWTLPMAIRYLVWNHNADESFVKNPLKFDIEDTLVARIPIPGAVFDPGDAFTYTTEDLIVPDKPIDGRDWPSVVQELIRREGFDMEWVLNLEDRGGGFGTLVTYLRLFLWQSGPLKPVWLQPAGQTVDPARSNVAQADMGLSAHETINAWVVQGQAVQYEVSFILVPLFPMKLVDATADEAFRLFDRDNPNQVDKRLYRIYGLDETGDGAYLPGTDTKITADPVSFDSVFGVGKWVRRRRKPIGRLFSTEFVGKPESARLDYANDYTGDKPGIWDGTIGTWYPITSGWRLLPDRIGIEVTAQNANAWDGGVKPDDAAPYIIYGVEWQKPGSPDNFVLRLTCVVESDEIVQGIADRTDRSRLPYQVTRVIDASDRYKKQIVHIDSLFNDTGVVRVVRDDTAKAKAEAVANRSASETFMIDGTITLAYITNYYAIGDRIESINGVDLSFQVGGELGAVYPIVESLRWNFVPERSTLIGLAEESIQLHKIERHAQRSIAE